MWELTVRWTRHGKVLWEDWWTERHGQRLAQQSSMDQHVGFANYDLAQNGLPKLVPLGGDRFRLPLVPQARLEVATDVLAFHGFEVESSREI
jgi:hypothetical protein